VVAFSVVSLTLIIGARVVARLVRRRRPRLSLAIRAGLLVLIYVDVAVIFGWVALGAAREEGRRADAFAVGFGVLALLSLGLAAFFAWAWLKVGLGDEEP
jgi:hypothetical protein